MTAKKEKIKLPRCKDHPKEKEFIVKEAKRTSGKFSIVDGGLVFNQMHDTADLETDEVLCGKCYDPVDWEPFDWSDS